MSARKPRRTNGHVFKRRKLSHDSSDERESSVESAASLDNVEDGDPSNDEGAAVTSNHADKTSQIAVDLPVQLRHSRISRVAQGSTTLPGDLQMQVSNLLNDVRLDHDSVTKQMRPTTNMLVEVLKEVPSQQPMSLAQAQSFSQKNLRITIPWFQRPATDVKYTFSFVAPTRVTLAGSLAQRLSTKKQPRKLVLMPEMPAEMFHEKDYLNYRAVHKRAFYLACIASHIQKKTGKEFDMNFAYSDDCEFVPVIRLTENSSERPLIFEVCPVFPSTLGLKEKMTPMHNCLRKEDLSNDIANATPAYNSCVRYLTSTKPWQELVESAITKAENYCDACYLGSVWLQQRDMSGDQAQGGFGLEEWAVLCALLLQSGGHQGRPLFSPRYSALQLFKAMLQVLGGRDMYEPLLLRGNVNLRKSDLPIIYDADTGVNILYKMTPWSYERLKHHATVSLAAVNSKKTNGFEATFVTKVSETSLEFEQSYTIDLTDSSQKSHDTPQRIHSILRKGFSDRVRLLHLQTDLKPGWKITSSAPSTSPAKVVVGLLINSEAALRFVDHGPSVEDKEAAEDFRQFWGEKAELRKFNDGSINESLVWSKDSCVLEQIVKHLLLRHLKIAPTNIKISPYVQKLQLSDAVPADEAFTVINTKLQALVSTLHHLDGLPLPIRSVNAASELMRSTSLALPLEPGFAQPVDLVIQFDTSGRWPDDLRAIQYTKIAFLTKIGDLLIQHDRTWECRVGLENTSSSSLGTHNNCFLDIKQPSPTPQLPPIIFRLRIYHERELHLIQQALSTKALLSQPLRDAYQSALQTQKQTLARVNHTTAIRSFSTTFPTLSATTRLLKRFLSVHHLMPHIPGEVAEIIACDVFLNPAPWSTPGTSTTAFTRCLHFLSRWDWSAEPLIVDLSPAQDMTLQRRQELETRFMAWRKLDPNMNSVAWFIGTNLDNTGVVWTQGLAGQDPKLPRVVASRLTALASAALQLMKSADQREDKLMTQSDWDDIFTSSSEDFDFVIHLKDSVANAARRSQKANKEGKFKNLQLANMVDVDTTGIDTATSYLEDLQHSFGNVAIFFHGGEYSGSTVIGGLWRPHVRPGVARAFKIRLGMSTVPYETGDVQGEDEEGICTANIEGMLAEMGTIGEGIVSKITRKQTS
ncbi:U3 snoRNP protein [Lithohypha guttulata]|uniref:U3 small nucleolar RNA-associated protein 22 n=1 Tax=Lithohypha guttulata TaxID=1690604 RepID=A0AAN7YDV9_9EURO|nr:U3 snoRNP protein [Lithohypha guttulata]